MSLKLHLNLLEYLRKSREDLAAEARGEGDTLAKHRRALAAYVDQHGHSIIGVFEEVVSGERIVDRPEMQKMLHALNEGKYNGKKIDGVICIDEYRLGRGNMIDQGIIQDTFKTNKMILVTPRKVYDPESELDEEWFEFESFMARREFKMINRRLQRGRRQSAAEGKCVGKLPYGYIKGKDLVLRPHPEESRIVKIIFDWAVEGMGRKVIANKLTDLGVPTPSGKIDVWQQTTIKKILANRVYLGEVEFGKSKYSKKDLGGYHVEKVHDSSKWIRKENAHEPLISVELFDRAGDAVKRRIPPIKSGSPISNPFASLIKCGVCGYSLRRQIHKQNNADRLICSHYKCKNRSTNFILVEDRLIRTLQKFLSGFELELGQNQVKIQPTKELLNARIVTLEKQEIDLKKQSDNIHDLLEQGVYTVEKFLERTTDLQVKANKVKEELESCRKDVERMIEMDYHKKEALPRLINVLNTYHTLSPEDRNKLLKTIVQKMVYFRAEGTRLDEFSLEVFLDV
ncbi:recombinase family protein [Tumebacillus permanentifrigoris]|uniref:DNA invertase Pin-like site-specific DNA recombinase n=1 Tax=Tumebacillus permanentifrigoris TaxID=378543 RepID=A0A316D3A7_9BACL|nr:recombinase family protein [Tumebacillus permanentifrigoris]PWK05284.1 DNA invertase Pin-like site-specific DNA recombinase [Tumebacillus permanentifrigoris]